MLFYTIIALNSKFIDKLAKKMHWLFVNNNKQNQQNGDIA